MPNKMRIYDPAGIPAPEASVIVIGSRDRRHCDAIIHGIGNRRERAFDKAGRRRSRRNGKINIGIAERRIDKK